MAFKKRFLILLISVVSSVFLTPVASPADQVTDVNLFKNCISISDNNCIESISAQDQDGKSYPAIPTGRFTNYSLGNDSFASHIKGFGEEWDFQGLKFQNGTGKIIIFSYYIPPSFLHCWNDGNCSQNVEEFNTLIWPSNIDGGGPLQSQKLTGTNAIQVCPSNPNNCTISSSQWLFDSDVTITFNVRISSNMIPAYAAGRAKNVTITYSSLDSNTNKMTISASPLKLQQVFYGVPDSSIFERAFAIDDEINIFIGGSKNMSVNRLGPCWNVPGVHGGVQIMTNAYGWTLPYWSTTDQMIKSDLKAPHFSVDGTINTGYLEISIPTEEAKCMWGVDLKNNVEAKVQFLDENGETQVIMALAKLYKSEYRLSVSGFHYSSPTVGIKLLDTSNTPSQQSKRTSSATNLPKKFIICISKKVKKVFAAVNICPKGYTLKK